MHISLGVSIGRLDEREARTKCNACCMLQVTRVGAHKTARRGNGIGRRAVGQLHWRTGRARSIYVSIHECTLGTNGLPKVCALGTNGLPRSCGLGT